MVRHYRGVAIAERKRRIDSIPAPILFVLSGISMYLGAAVAVWLFDAASPGGVAWLRCLGAALILLAWRRPPWSAWRGKPLLLAGAFGLVTAGMNVVFYEAIARLPLGTVVALEFTGPVVVAAFGSRGRRDIAALVLVAAGVVCIADVQLRGSPSGVAFALAAAAAWAGYILLGKKVALGGNGIDSLAVGFAVATVLLSPLALGTGGVWGSPSLLTMGIGVGLLATVVPYVLDQVVLRRLGQARFAVLLALLPVTASIIGFVVLDQVPSVLEAAGILAVVGGVALRSRDEAREPP
ncbi:inner membrane transporter RhtA [Prauserella marina]|uniref:Inner membrane transporter RhtA n=2 Tax=Prauserella marina TaxID=530584 RepID=A0A1G6J7X5_9PSEU|nr:inner membrane transporter RhtA [Prauserella marina]SDC14787.1 inner membrane transporter RhtA [Prauserella marina]